MRTIQKIRLVMGLAALVLPILALTAIVVGVLLFRQDMLSLRASQIWLIAAGATGALALLVLIVGRAAKWVSWRWMLLLALPALAPIAAGVAAVRYLETHPSTAEISTDLVDAPAFTGPAAAPFPEGLAMIGRQRHAAVRSLTIPLAPDQAFAKARDVASARPGWTVTTSEAPYSLQGTAVFGRFRYQRDWVIRVRPELGGGSLIDMRIRSKPGEPDLGGNAVAVQSYLDALRAEAR